MLLGDVVDGCQRRVGMDADRVGSAERVPAPAPEAVYLHGIWHVAVRCTFGLPLSLTACCSYQVSLCAALSTVFG